MSGDVQSVNPQGRLDGNSSGEFERAIVASIAAGTRALLINFDRLDYISSAGLRSILVIAKRMKSSGGNLALCGLKPAIADVFRVSGFAGIMDIHPDADSAMRKLSSI